ncbi:MAG: hypothetical protein JXA57_19030 [Armatimonadetes bacterium]|nr:hypothetical protein [Armatimonadota bacterium]
MGAFHLVVGDRPDGIARANAVFERRGLQLGRKVAIGSTTLYLFRKKWIGHGNWIEIHGAAHRGAASIGTLVYKKRFGREAVELLASDVIEKRVDTSRLLGDYVFLLWTDATLAIAQSRNQMLHLYVNRARTALGSSFLAVASAEAGGTEINRQVILRNLLTGCEFGGATLLKDVDRVVDLRIIASRMGLRALDLSAEALFTFRDRREAIEAIESELNCYFREIEDFASSCSASLGLSGGYDSRLLLGCLSRLHCEIIPHTHWKEVEDRETRIARQLAEKVGVRLVRVKVPIGDETGPERLRQNLEEGYWTCDGNVRVNLGWLSEYRREEYRRRIAVRARLGLNGIGGELLRNHRHFTSPRKRLGDWIREIVFEPYSPWYLRREAREDVIASLGESVRALLGWPEDKEHVSRLDDRSFYSRCWVVGGPSLRNNVEHPCWYFLSPFCEWRIVEAALAATDFVGVDGRFEAELIRRSHPGLAAIETNYGHSFSRTSGGDLVRAWLKGTQPTAARALGRRIKLQQRQRAKGGNCREIAQAFQEDLGALKDMGLPFQWDRIECDDWALNRAVALGRFVRKHA